MKLECEPYIDQKRKWPASGQHILAQFDDEGTSAPSGSEARPDALEDFAADEEDDDRLIAVLPGLFRGDAHLAGMSFGCGGLAKDVLHVRPRRASDFAVFVGWACFANPKAPSWHDTSHTRA